MNTHMAINLIMAFVGGFSCRVVRTLLESSPYILLGLASSGLIRATVGPARLRRFFGGGRWSGLFRAWGTATLLPVCALGVLPVIRELRRSGVRRDVVLTFALAAPMFNPITLLSAFSHLSFGLLVNLLAGSAAVAIVAGALAGRSTLEEEAAAIDEPPLPAGRRRGALAAVHALQEASGTVWLDLAAGLTAAGLVSAVVSPAWLAEGTFSGDPWSVFRMVVVAPAAYVSPEAGVTSLPEMVKFRQSAGAMLALIVLGVGMTAGHVAWIVRTYGLAVAIRWCVALTVATFAGARAVELGHAPVGAVNPDNDHYDVLVSPIPVDRPSLAFRTLTETVGRAGAAGLAAPVVLGLTVAAGLALRSGRLGLKSRFEEWTEPSDADDGREESCGTNATVFDRPLPGWIVRAIVASSAVALLFVGACVLFPSPEETFRDMSVIKADYYGEIGAVDVAVPLHHLDLWERSAARLPLGAAIRLRFPNAETRRLSSDLMESLRSLRSATASKAPETARALFHELQPVYDRCRRAYDVD
jgi:uncharacterized protein